MRRKQQQPPTKSSDEAEAFRTAAAGMRKTAEAMKALGALLVLLLAGCTPSRQLPPETVLHLPGVVEVPGIRPLERQIHNNVISALAAYVPADRRDGPHVRVVWAGNTYDLRLDGGGLQGVPSCGSPLAVTPDGRWAACRSDAGIALQAVADARSAAAQLVLPNTSDGYQGSPTWAPDGRHLAIIGPREGQCALQVYEATPDYGSVQLVAALNLPQYTLHGPTGAVCDIGTLAWSPDGRWFAFDLHSKLGIYLLSLTTLLPVLLAPTPTGSPVTTSVSSTQVTLLTADGSAPRWTPKGDAVTYVQQLDWDIKQVSVLTKQTTTVLSQHLGGIGDIAWTPDEQHLVFDLALPTGETELYPMQLYVYTP
jgi:WD40-like Beta Propeller Repeat